MFSLIFIIFHDFFKKGSNYSDYLIGFSWIMMILCEEIVF